MTKTSTKVSVGKSGLIKKVLIIVGAGLLVAFAVVLTFLLISSMFSPVDVRVSNVTSNSATVSWVTDNASEGFAIPVKGEEAAVWKFVANKDALTYDDRDYTLAELEAAKVNAELAVSEEDFSGEDFVTEVKVEDAGEYQVHHVTFRNLEPDTDYTFYVGDGKVLNRAAGEDGQSLFKTFPQEDEEVLSVPDPAYGKIYDESDVATLTFDAIVYLEIVDDGAGKTSTLISAVVSKDSWYLDLNSAKDSETGKPFLSNITLPNETVYHKVFVEGGNLGVNETAFTLEADAPALPIGLPGSDSEESSSVLDFFVKDTYAWSMTCPENGKRYECDAACEATFKANDKDEGDWKAEASGHCPDPNVPGVDETPQEPGTGGGGGSSQCTDNASCCGPNYASHIKEAGDPCGGATVFCPSQGGCDGFGELACLKDEKGEYKCTKPGGTTECNTSNCNGDSECKYFGSEIECVKKSSGAPPVTSEPTTEKCSTAKCAPPKTCDFVNYPALGKCVDKIETTPAVCRNSKVSTVQGLPHCDTAGCSYYSFKDCTVKGCFPTGTAKEALCKDTKTSCTATPSPGASCEGPCEAKVVNDFACTNVGPGSFIWRRIIDNQESCPDDSPCLCAPNKESVSVTCSQSGTFIPGAVTISANTKCTNPNEKGGCICLQSFFAIKSNLDEGEWCRQVQDCNGGVSVIGAVCSTNGNRCAEDKSRPIPVQCDGAPSSSVPEQEELLISSTSSAQVLGASTSIVISPSEGSLSIQTEGLYCYQDTKEKYCFEVKSPGEHVLYIDTNNDGAYTEGVDKNIAADGTEVKLEMESSIDSFTVSEGFNLVSFKSVFPEDSNMASVFLKKLNEQYNDSFYQIAKYDNGWKVITNRDGDDYGSNDFQIIPGEGYLLRSKSDMIIELSGQRVASAVPINLKAGWNLIGLHGATKSYTAESLIDSMNTGGIKSDNVTRWVVDKSKYEGLQKETDSAGVKNVYGFDFPLTSNIGYFVKVSEGGGQWKPE